jgi:hypothetical protein
MGITVAKVGKGALDAPNLSPRARPIILTKARTQPFNFFALNLNAIISMPPSQIFLNELHLPVGRHTVVRMNL